MKGLRTRLREFTDPVPSEQRPHHVRNGAVIVAVALFVFYCAVTGNIPLLFGPPGEPVFAEVRSATQLDDTTPVRVGGVRVGNVRRVTAARDPRRASRVEMRITNPDIKVRRDARIDIRWRTILGGEMYVDLQPGSPSAPVLADDEVIPVERTTSQVELDQVLQPYDGATAEGQRRLLRGLAQGFGDPPGTGRSIEALPGLRTVERGTEPVRGRAPDDIETMVAATGRTLAVLGADTGELQRLVDGADRTLGALNTNRESLGATVAEGPATLDETLATMTRLRATLDHLDPLVENLRPGVRQLGPASRAARPALAQARALLREARPLLRDARPTFASLTSASRSGVPLLRELDPSVRRLDREIVPWLAERDDETKLLNHQAIGPFFAATGGAGMEFDDEGYRLRLTVPAGSNSALALALDDFRTTCRTVVAEPRRDDCDPLSRVLVQGWFGRERPAR